MSDKDRYAGETYDPSLAHCTALELKFDGSTLKLTGGSNEYSYPAVSGRPRKDGTFNYSKAAQMGPNTGPIPEGIYWVNPDELWTNRWFKPASEDAWGKYRLTIHPFTTTQTNKRGGFFIHGGKTPGSAGCIDLTSKISDFVADLEKEGRQESAKFTLPFSTRRRESDVKVSGLRAAVSGGGNDMSLACVQLRSTVRSFRLRSTVLWSHDKHGQVE